MTRGKLEMGHQCEGETCVCVVIYPRCTYNARPPRSCRLLRRICYFKRRDIDEVVLISSRR